VRRFLAGLLILLLVAGIAFSGRDTTTSALQFCTPKPTLMQRGTSIASRIGSVVPALSRPLPTERFAINIRGAWYTLGYWFGVMGAAMGGKPAPEPVIEPVDCSVLFDPCKDETGNSGIPYNPKSASLAGPALAADALRRAGFPADEIPTFVAIAKHETGFRNISGPTVGAGTMRGMWQLNDQYWKLDNWQDPYANAVMAKRVRDESVQTRGNPYYPWSTWRAAVRDAGTYARYGTPVPAGGGGEVAAAAVAPAPTAPKTSLDQGGESFTPDSDCSAVGLGVTIGTWNTAGKIGNSPAQINASAGFADVVGLQEIRDNARLRPAGYGVTPGSMAVPIIWNRAKLDLVKWRREDSLKGYAKDKSVVWAIFKVKASGAQFAVVNTHQLVEGGKGWHVQAAKVSDVVKRLQGHGLPTVLVGDMNAGQAEVAAAFGAAGVGGSIDRIIGYGVKPTKPAELSFAGSDHHRRLATFAAAAPTKASGAAASIAGSQYAGGSGEAGIRAMAKAHGAPFNPHTDPQGMTAADLTSSGKQNTDLAEDLRAHHEELGIRYVISQMRIASDREGWVWRPYSPITNAGDFRHTGHVHVSYGGTS
jgi:hypothetical protein